MIGIYLKQRRREFLEFAAINPIDYEEILDPDDELTLSQFSKIFIDDPTFPVGSFDVTDINSQDISDTFTPYIKKHKLSTVYTKERFYNAIFYYFERVYRKCVPITAKPIEDAPQNKSSVAEPAIPSILKRSLINQIDEISGVIDSEDSIAINIDDLAVENIEPAASQDSDAVQNIQQVYSSEPVQPVQSAQPVYQPESVQPVQTMQQLYQPEPIQAAFQQAPPMYSVPNMPPTAGYQQTFPNQTPWMQSTPSQAPWMQQYGQYQSVSAYTPQMGTQSSFQQQNTTMFMPQQEYTEFSTGFVPASMQPQQMIPEIAKEPLRQGGAQMRRRGTSAHKRLGAPIYTFSSLTDKAGTTTIAFLLAKTMAVQNPGMKIIYLDLNLSNPNTISNYLGYDRSDATLVNVATATNIDFAANISLLTDTIQASNGYTFSMITFGETTFKQKTAFLTIDYSQFLDILADSFDVVFVDIGKLQGTLAYQHFLMRSPLSKHILVADGSTSGLLNTFITATKGLMYGFEIVVNKSLPSVGTFLLNKQLGIAPLGVIGNHNNTMRFITDAVPFDGSVMQKELWVLGGAL